MVKIFGLVVSILLLLIAGCNTVRDEMAPEINTEIDSEGFYTERAGDFVLKYKVEDSVNLHCRLTGAGTGWISVGFAPSAQMKDANFIIGYYDNSTGFISDEFGVTSYSHEPDINLGGTSDVTLLSAYETDGKTSLEFKIPLDSGDTKDRVLSLGTTYPVIFAAGDADDFVTIHSQYDFGAILIRN
ncbi:MAG: hypothetical protein JXR56_09560 [Candidatus Cloacimonetes bacterium]|nr:hypothetical protein [Candidatus Cloacimonadota bacterium]